MGTTEHMIHCKCGYDICLDCYDVLTRTHISTTTTTSPQLPPPSPPTTTTESDPPAPRRTKTATTKAKMSKMRSWPTKPAGP